jgi:hypothetical protein
MYKQGYHIYVHLHAGFALSMMVSVLYTALPVACRLLSAAVLSFGRAKNLR